jgi:5-methylthioribose kinase
LVHGDYSPKNVLIHADRLVLLDHEVIHFGDPAFDLGFALTHLLSKAHHMPPYRREFLAAADEFWQVYSQAAAANLESRAVRHTLACLLARVAGRSPLEYLTPQERLRQHDAVLRIMPNPPQSIAGLVRTFERQLCP